MLVTEQIKQLVVPGDVLGSFNRKHLLSKTIAEVTHSDFSHVFLYLGYGKILESAATGVAIRDLDYYLNWDKYYLGLYRLPIRDDLILQFISACKKYRGVHYGYLQILWLSLLYKLKIRETTWWEVDLPGIICTELIAKGANDVRFYPWDKPPASLSPGEIIEKLTKIV